MQMLNTNEAAKILNVHAVTLSKWVRNKKPGLVCYRVGRDLKFKREDVEAFLQSCKTGCRPEEVQA
jgi:excisionase family DNA binding protein